MGRLKKKEFIEKHGEEAWERWLEQARLANRKYYSNTKEKHKQRRKKYYLENKETIIQKNSKYSSEHYWTQSSRAAHLLKCYQKADENAERGNCTLTKHWIIEHIFNSSCVYCGETDWKKLGCDRIDNVLPHTPENCVCSCRSCNIERNRKPYTEFIKLKKGAA